MKPVNSLLTRSYRELVDIKFKILLPHDQKSVLKDYY